MRARHKINKKGGNIEPYKEFDILKIFPLNFNPKGTND